MRVISEFHDYYDVVQGLGQDQTQIYLRTPKKEYYTNNQYNQNINNPGVSKNDGNKLTQVYPFPYFYTNSYRDINYFKHIPDFAQYVIGFCGKIYPCLQVNEHYCYTIEDVDTQIEPHLKAKAIDEYRNPKKGRWSSRNRYYPHDVRREILEKFFAKIHEQNSKYESIFVENKCPVFITTLFENGWRSNQSWIEYNGCLKDVEFYRIMEPYTAFQEISMYFGNIAQPNRPIPDVSDADLIVAKGFDKYSFRKDKHE